MAKARIIAFNGAYYTKDGTLRNLDGTIGPNSNASDITPFNGVFIGADGAEHDISEILDAVYNNTGGGVSNYILLTNKPRINGVELSGDKTAAELGITAYSPPYYEHTQSTAATQWNVQHNFDQKYVNAIILDSNNERIVGYEDWNVSTNNLLVLRFSEAVSGKVIVR